MYCPLKTNKVINLCIYSCVDIWYMSTNISETNTRWCLSLPVLYYCTWLYTVKSMNKKAMADITLFWDTINWGPWTWGFKPFNVPFINWNLTKGILNHCLNQRPWKGMGLSPVARNKWDRSWLQQVCGHTKRWRELFWKALSEEGCCIDKEYNTRGNFPDRSLSYRFYIHHHKLTMCRFKSNSFFAGLIRKFILVCKLLIYICACASAFVLWPFLGISVSPVYF